MENALRAKPRDLREQYEQKIKELTSAYGEAMLENNDCHTVLKLNQACYPLRHVVPSAVSKMAIPSAAS